MNAVEKRTRGDVPAARKRLKLAALIAVLSLSGCDILGTIRVEDACSWVKQVTPTDTDLSAASTTLLAQILVHNEEWEKNCNTT